MSYTESKMGRVVVASGGLATVALQTPADKFLIHILGPITVYRIGGLVTTAMTVTAAVLDWDRRITPGSDTGRIDQGVGRVTFPVTGSAIGQIVYKDVAVDLNPGDEVVVSLTTAATAGAAIPLFEYVPRDAPPTDFTEMVASA